MQITSASIRRPVTVAMIFVAALVFGLVSLGRLRVNLLPDLTYPTLTIQTILPDAAPEEVENLVTRPLEESAGVVHGVREIRSASRSGMSEITLEFAWGTKMDYASLDVREKIDLVNLPDEARSPVLLRFDPALEPILRIGIYGDTELTHLRWLAEHLYKRELESLIGVASAKVQGGLEEEIRIEVDDAKLAIYGFSMAEITQRLASENINLSGGRLRDRNAEFLIRTLNTYRDLDDIGETILRHNEGRVLRLKDVAKITRSTREREVISRIEGKENVEIAIYKEGDANTVEVARKIREEFKQINKQLPELVHAQILSDQSVFIENAVGEVRSNAFVGGILAILILFLFLRDVRSTLTIGLAIPISVIATFMFMLRANVSLNIMSLGGLALGVGMLVDNSIVVLEAMVRHLRAGASRAEAAERGASEVGQAVVASTLTTICVFLPIIFVEGMAGQIFKDQALTVTFSLLISLAVAVTLIPMMAAIDRKGPAPLPEIIERARNPRWWRRYASATGGFVFFSLPTQFLWGVRILVKSIGWLVFTLLYPLRRSFDAIYPRLERAYPKVLESTLRRRTTLYIIILIAGAFTVLLGGRLGRQLIPPFSQGEFAFQIELPVGTPLDETSKVLGRMEKLAAGMEGVESYLATVGTASRSGMNAAIQQENRGEFFVRLKPGISKRREEEIVDNLRDRFAGIPAVTVEFTRPSYFTFRSPVELVIHGYDLNDLRLVADQMVERLQHVEGLKDITSSVQKGHPEVRIIFDRDRLAALDLSMEGVARALRAKIHGEVATRFDEKDREIDIRIATKEGRYADLESVEALIVGHSNGIPIRLSAVAEITRDLGPSQVLRIGQQRAAIVTANLEGRDLGSASHEIMQQVRQVPLTSDMSVILAGQNEEFLSSYKSLLFAIVLAIFLVYLVMASQFENLLQPLIIMVTVPLGLMGVIWILALTGIDFSVVVLIGVIMLAGIVVNNGIVLIDMMNQLRRDEGLPLQEAVVKAAHLRLRPIVMTTTTTVLALLPMALGFGEGGEIRAPMAVTVIGGLLLSTALTLLVIPSLYTTISSWRRRGVGAAGSGAPDHAVVEP
ncbi:MAG: efflux RND transporter permease subunit [Candidatus Eisenbacteria bacterium]|uniref:Efflux RND transporter permease subunit n=1 Tax=Eiseniibacteriota bacterium TaxID=2212470 RepID=A0A948RX25_UNCEI|nr:efflux RND transporter permease subunit [Candidatus Eisenbacteria bacterium]MBU1950586.1 efflux RND transporter permease subunit [Candidatus Eisenbacteria bacterium]MBU2692613.1 efflux RND transporter permease subunit [Candidatus Eisenbacteria bacterium]